MDVCYKVEDSQVDNLSQLLSGESTTPEQLATLKKILSWPQGKQHHPLDFEGELCGGAFTPGAVGHQIDLS